MGWAALASAALGLVACGGSVVLESDGHGGSGGEGTSPGGHGGSGGDTGGAGAAGGGGAAGSGGIAGQGGVAGGGGSSGVGGEGYVALLKDLNGDSALAFFQGSYGPDCPVVTKIMGDCGFLQQPASCGPELRDGGTVTIQTPISTTTLTPDSPSIVADSPLFQPDDVIVMKSTGGADVPAFSEETHAPPWLLLTSPSFATTISVDKAAGLPVTWPATTGRVAVVLGNNADPMRFISCDFDGASGAGTVPPELLAEYSDSTGFISVYAIQRKDIQAGGWPVHLLAEILVMDAQGYPALMDFTLQ